MFDIDGAEYTYTLASDGVTWTPPAGQHATLVADNAECEFLWTKTSGTTYEFDSPYEPVGCTRPYASYTGYDGRLLEIIGRNSNNYIVLHYSWLNGNAMANGEITQITATTESGMVTTLNFASVNGHQLLQELVFPDGKTVVNYSYDNNGNLTQIVRPGPSSNGTATEWYEYWTTPFNTYMLAFVASPRWTVNAGGCSNPQTDCGGTLDFRYTAGASVGTTTLNLIQHMAWVDPTVPDGTNAGPIQPLPPNAGGNAEGAYLDEFFDLRSLGTAGASSVEDTDGHYTVWIMDALGRSTQTQECPAPQGTSSTGMTCPGTDLLSDETWDANNNLVSEIDPRGYETDHAFDASGNEVAVAEPSQTAQTSNGAAIFRPTQLYDYDAFNNLVAYCDQKAAHAAAADWVTPPTANLDSLCTTATAGTGTPHTRLAYTYPAYETYGELSTLTKPLGYVERFLYNVASQGGADYGLPSDVIGTAMSQSIDATTPTRTPHQYFSYDTNGDLVTYNKGNGNWTLTYDALNRMTSDTDPDGVTTRHCYFPDGSKSAEQSAEQYALDGSVCGTNSTSWTYDPDGNAITETHHYGSSTPGVTQKWYDGDDRLVEVGAPMNLAGLPGMYTRYKYDLSAGGTVGIENGPTGRAYGGLFATQRGISGPDGIWGDHGGSLFDGLDRQTARVSYPLTAGNESSTFPTASATTFVYDADTAHFGLLSSQTDGNGTVTSKNYDPSARLQSITFSDGTPERTYTYDEDGRQAIVTSSVGTSTDQYDADGRKTSDVQTNSTGSETLSYAYYPDGLREALSASGAVTQANMETLAYRIDGQREAEAFTNDGSASSFSWSYTPTGRRTAFVDPTGSHTSTYDAYGQLNTDTIPSGAYTFLTRDPEGQPLTYSAFAGTNIGGNPTPNLTSTVMFDASNESLGSCYPAGTVCPTPVGPCTTMTCGGQKFEAYEGLELMQPSNNTVPQEENLYTFDSAGRQTGRHMQWDYNQETCTTPPMPGHPGGGGGSVQCTIAGSWNSARSYDAENHLIGESPPPPVGQQFYQFYCQHIQGPFYASQSEGGGPAATPVTEYVYGPTGKLVLDSVAGNPTQTLYWDGDQLLFAGSGSRYAVYLDEFGATWSNSTAAPTIVDRDYSGSAVSMHNSTGHDAWYNPNLYLANRVGLCPQSSAAVLTDYPAATTTFAPSMPLIWMPRTDGITDGYNTIQGARSFDNITGQWTAPDAYQGDPEDPLSQNAYMWNRNNPYSYTDPSGYCIEDACIVEGAIAWEVGSWAVGAIVGGLTGHALAQATNGPPSQSAPQPQPAPAPKAQSGGNTNPYAGPVSSGVTAVDSHGNAIPVEPGESIGASKDGQWQDVKDGVGNSTGTQLHRPGHPTQKDPLAQQPHGHRPGVTTPDGNPHLPVH